jgi:predicted HTH transcriptional regulator
MERLSLVSVGESPMTPEELSTAIALGREQRNTEFKGPGLRSDKHFLAKVIRAILGMANKPDGGVVVVGVEDDDTRLLPVGLTPAELKTWTYDDLHSSVSNYADPYVDFEVVPIHLDGKDFVAIKIQEFSDIPVICKRDCGNTLRNGALYVRRRGKNETVDIPSSRRNARSNRARGRKCGSKDARNRISHRTTDRLFR